MCLFKISFAYATDADVQAVSPFEPTVKTAAMNILSYYCIKLLTKNTPDPLHPNSS